jgi:RNA polymerase sigma-70 factor (ECF subfamily)
MSERMPDAEETQDLLVRARAGDRAAAERLFALHRDYLLRLVELRLDPRLRARVGPSDVVQDAQLEAFRRLGAYLDSPPMPFRLWMRQITCERLLKARRHHLDTARRAAAREVPLPDHSSLALARQLLAREPTPSEVLDQRELARRLREAMAALAESDHEILVLRNFEGLSYEEIGYLLETEPAAARKRHARALVQPHQALFGGNTKSSP